MECKECESNYVGETGRCLQDRINEHKKDVRKKNERSNIYQHVRNTEHEFKFEEVKVLDEANAIKRRFLEEVHTLMNRDTTNKALDISLFFHPIQNAVLGTSFPTPGAPFLPKMSHFQSRGHNFD